MISAFCSLAFFDNVVIIKKRHGMDTTGIAEWWLSLEGEHRNLELGDSIF